MNKIFTRQYCQTLQVNSTYMKTPPDQKLDKENKIDPTSYPANEDIYNKGIEEVDIDPEDTTKLKVPNEMETDSIDELDIPGTELDDEEENIGNEDEENNYYSLGGDNHNNLDEQDATEDTD